MSEKPRILVAMSGGVDSSVAAALLRDQGYDCTGVFMCLGHAGDTKGEHKGCCSPADARDAREVAESLGINFHVIEFQKEFNGIVDYFVDEYARGRTPNPCIQCNNHLKFGKLVDYADLVGADYVATGHYARIVETEDGQRKLARGLDYTKDQSYVLFGLEKKNFDRAMFPLGGYPKDEVRRMAEKYNLHQVCDKPDSQEICFIPDNNYARLVALRHPQLVKQGNFLNMQGKVIGTHRGVHNFTIGQRRGLGFNIDNTPSYVVRLNVDTNEVVIGKNEDLMLSGVYVKTVNWLNGVRREPFKACSQIRYGNGGATSKVTPIANDEGTITEVNISFDEPVRAITPGQACVFFDDDDCVIGGGWIESSQWA